MRENEQLLFSLCLCSNKYPVTVTVTVTVLFATTTTRGGIMMLATFAVGTHETVGGGGRRRRRRRSRRRRARSPAAMDEEGALQAGLTPKEGVSKLWGEPPTVTVTVTVTVVTVYLFLQRILKEHDQPTVTNTVYLF
jgi:hypothetical protein